MIDIINQRRGTITMIDIVRRRERLSEEIFKNRFISNTFLQLAVTQEKHVRRSISNFRIRTGFEVGSLSKMECTHHIPGVVQAVISRYFFRISFI